MVTIHDVAARAGVSAMTVSRVLNGSQRVAPETRQRIERAIEELGYFPNALARGLLSGRTKTIGLLVGDITNPYCTALASGAEEVAHRNGYAMVLGNVSNSAEKAAQLVQTFISNRVDGLLINAGPRDAFKTLIKRKYPMVIIGPEFKGVKTDFVTGDNYYGAQVLTRHLIGLGHRQIALLNGPKGDSEAMWREQGFRQTLREHDIEPHDGWIVECSYWRGESYEPARQILSLPPKQRPTAIIASNNFIGLAVIEAARNLGVRIPEDVALVGFDDFELASVIYPFLTVMSQPVRTYGVQAAQLLIDHLNNPDQWQPSRLVFTPEFIIRKSCGAHLQRQVSPTQDESAST